ncbi:MAG: hypothetical protein WAM70_20605 [Pyrinomonadaceae bacterium]
MKRIMSIELALFSLILIATCAPARPSAHSQLGVFVGTSPCDAVARRPLGIPASADCEMIKWNLSLHQEPGTLAPTTYELNFTYGMTQPNTTGFKNGGTKAERKGKWSIAQGTRADSGLLVYKLDAERPEESIAFVKLDENLLHLLDTDRALALGHAGWSYTLSRTEKLRSPTDPSKDAATPVQTTSNTNLSSSGATASSVLGRFVGRSPCVEVAREMNQTVEPDCIKVKWDLTLYHDAKTLAPTTYKLDGTFYREQTRKGTWKLLRGVGANPGAVIYQLDPDASQGSLLFLQADDNVLYFLDRSRNLLVGNNDFSYTLNRLN